MHTSSLGTSPLLAQYPEERLAAQMRGRQVLHFNQAPHRQKSRNVINFSKIDLKKSIKLKDVGLAFIRGRA